MWKLLMLLLVGSNIWGMDIDKRPDILKAAYNNLNWEQKQDVSEILYNLENGKRGLFKVANDSMQLYEQTIKKLQNPNFEHSKLKPEPNAVLFSYGYSEDPCNGFSIVLGCYVYWFTEKFVRGYVEAETNKNMEEVYESMFNCGAHEE